VTPEGANADQRWDLAIVGGGPGGYIAGIRAGQLGMKSVLVEADRVGGICLNWGCIPTKALLRNAEVWRLFREARTWGVTCSDLGYDFGKVVKRSRDVSDRLSKGVSGLLKKYGCAQKSGWARLAGSGPDGFVIEIASAGGSGAGSSGSGTGSSGPGTSSSGTAAASPGSGKGSSGSPGEAAAVERIIARRVLIATGARPRALPSTPFDRETILTSREAMVLPAVPESLLIVGAGAIGVEFASIYEAFGSRVTIVEMLDHLLPIEDDEVARELEKIFQKRGVAVHTSTRVETLEKVDINGRPGVRAQLTTPKGPVTVEAEKALVAIGLIGNTEDLGIEQVGVTVERSFIQASRDTYETSVPGIFAIGDVIGPPLLAHVASAEALVAVERMAGHDRPPLDYGQIPGCTYSHPQVASVGLTERKAREQGLDLKIGRFPFRASGKSLAQGETAGFVKLIYDARYGGLLGAHIIGSEATELIAELGLGLHLETTGRDILDTVHAHPTLAEAVAEATGDAFGEALNI